MVCFPRHCSIGAAGVVGCNFSPTATNLDQQAGRKRDIALDTGCTTQYSDRNSTPAIHHARAAWSNSRTGEDCLAHDTGSTPPPHGEHHLVRTTGGRCTATFRAMDLAIVFSGWLWWAGYGGNKRTAHSTARSLFSCCFTHFWRIFSVAETRWLQGFTYNNGGLHSILLTIAMVVVAAHTPCRGGGGVELKETSSARPTSEEGAPHGCPSLQRIRFDTFRVSNLTGYPFPQGGP